VATIFFRWSKPKNLGYPVNSTDDELFYYPIKDGNVAYLSKYDPNGFGRYDIERIHIFTIDNPRKYKVDGIIKVAGKLPQTFYLALYDRNKKDTVLRQRLTDDKVSFETVAGQYDVHIYTDGYDHQSHPLSIAWASKDINRNISFDLLPKSITTDSPNTLIAMKPVKEKEVKFNNKETQHISKSSNQQNGLESNKNKESISSDNNENKTDSLAKLTDTQLIQAKSDSVSNVIGKKQVGLISSMGKLFSNWIFDSTIGIISLFLIFWFLFKQRSKKEKQIS
jgi:hypothetical protein